MGTTVKYKGSTIATLSNETKTLNTAGTWVEGDISITDIFVKSKRYIATIITESPSSVRRAIYDGVSYYETGDTFTYNEGDTVVLRAIDGMGGYGAINIDGVNVASAQGSASYTYTLPNHNINIDGTAGGVLSVTNASLSNLQAKTGISPTTSSQTITADSGYDGLSSVQINAMPSGSASTPATTITANPSISISSSGLITATASASQNITPTVNAGYVSSGTAGTITVSGSKTQQLTTKGATTYNTSTSDQTIASGTYLTGTQTIKAVTVSGLDASKILSGTTIMVGDSNDADRIASVTGSVTFSTIRTGTSTPASSLGVNGDIYVKTS